MRTKSIGEYPIPKKYWTKNNTHIVKKPEPIIMFTNPNEETVHKMELLINSIKNRPRITQIELNEMLSLYNIYNNKQCRVNDMKPVTLYESLIKIIDDNRKFNK